MGWTQMWMDSNMVRADFGSGLICPQSSNKYRKVLCERRGTHVLALKHAAPRLRRLRLGLQTRAGHGPDGAHANRCACPAVEKFCRASSAAPPDFRTLYCLKWAKSVEKRHGLPISEARRCSACANPFACPAVERFCRASSAGGRRHLQ